MIELEHNHHYALTKDLTKLVGCQYKNIKKKQTCPHCLRGLQSIDTLKNILIVGV